MTTTHPLRRWLEETGTTQDELARLAGTQQPRVSNFLSGKERFGPELAGRMAEVTGIDLKYFVTEVPMAAKRQGRGQGTR